MYACMSFYQQNLKFNIAFNKGELDIARNILLSDKRAEKRNSKLLFYLNKGTVDFMLKNEYASNESFEKAYVFGQDYQKNVFDYTAPYFLNASFSEYQGENFEMLYIHYYKALNYLMVEKNEEALVECKRMDIKLNQLADKSVSSKKYTKDAFIHLLMGLIYEANFDLNNAFISYRNAYFAYKEFEEPILGVAAPLQLKQDILRTAHLVGFTSEKEYFEKEFGIKYKHNIQKDKGELIYFWQNGLGPVKDQIAIDFIITPGGNGIFIFNNQELGLSFSIPFPTENSKSIASLSFIRVAFPKYMERMNVIQKANLGYFQNEYPLQICQNVNNVAFRSLKDRMLLEIGQGLSRLVLKKVAEAALRTQNGYAGAGLSIINAITEQADTRNWQTLPHDIYYARVSLPEGNQKINLKTISESGNKSIDQTFKINKSRMSFGFYHNIDNNSTAINQ